MASKRYPLPKRFNVALSEKAYDNLRRLSEKYGYGNNYSLTVLLEHLEEITIREDVEQIFHNFKVKYGAPEGGTMQK